MRRFVIVACALALAVALDFATAYAAQASPKHKPAISTSPAIAAAQKYAGAVASGDRVTAGRMDFACQYGMVAASPAPLKAFPPDSDPIYARCWEQIARAHETAVMQRDEGITVLWPGKGSLVFFSEDLTEYAPSFFVMDRLGLSPPGSGLRIELLASAPLPAASFRVREGGSVVAAPATIVRLGVTYKDPLTSPVTYAPSEDNVTRKAKKVRQVLKGVTVKWVVLSGLRKLGFPGDVAVVNLPVTGADGPTIPFVTEKGGYVHDTRVWWGSADALGVLINAVARATRLPEQRDRIALLNRVLLVDPVQSGALTALSRELFQTLLNTGATAHKVPIGDAVLAARFNELYWNVYSQTSRTEIAESMEVGQRSHPTPADYLYRMLPAMEKLARVNPEDHENRLRLGIAYRWSNAYENAIAVHEALIKEISPDRAALRTRTLLELAWSRIAKVAWSRRFSDPDLVSAYQEAEESFKLAEAPLDKFMASYTMAYSGAFMPNRENKAMLDLLTEAHRWYLQVPGATQNSWQFLLRNDTLKGVIDADPSFQSLFIS
jgi:tetratricopeptide (TPR) repeat protein